MHFIAEAVENIKVEYSLRVDYTANERSSIKTNQR
jgi:hypothetical protein